MNTLDFHLLILLTFLWRPPAGSDSNLEHEFGLVISHFHVFVSHAGQCNSDEKKTFDD